MIFPAIPSTNRIQDKRNRLNTTLPIQAPFRNEDGALRRLDDVLEFLMSSPDHKHLMGDDDDGDIRIIMRFATDRANMVKKNNYVQGVVTLSPPGFGSQSSTYFRSALKTP